MADDARTMHLERVAFEAMQWAKANNVGADQPSLVFARRFAFLLHKTPPPSTGAQAVIQDGQIVISIDVDALPVIVSGSCGTGGLGGLWKVTDPAEFAEAVCSALNREEEDGTTRVHLMFDWAFDHAIDQGAEGIEEADDEEFEKEAARLQAALRHSDPP